VKLRAIENLASVGIKVTLYRCLDARGKDQPHGDSDG
jgi:hypothetical protein